jgi:hypothetical protein
VKPGGTIAFTDWVEGPSGLSSSEADRLLRFMKFPNIQDLEGYRALLEERGCEVSEASDTGRFAPCVDLYLEMVEKQLTYDALRILGFDEKLAQAVTGEARAGRDRRDALPPGTRARGQDRAGPLRRAPRRLTDSAQPRIASSLG